MAYVIRMDDNDLTAVADLLRRVERADFDRAILDFVCRAGLLRNFGAYFWTSLRRGQAVLSVAGGEIGSYWFHRDAHDFVSNPVVFDEIQSLVTTCQEGVASVARFAPHPSDPRCVNYRRAGISERLTVATRKGDTAILSFFLRSAADGPIGTEEFGRFETLLPLAHEVITIRHRIIGSEAFQFRPGLSTSSLKERGVALFQSLSAREALVCDLILAGQTVEGTALELGVSVNTIRTFRSRAYRKLRVTSAQQMMSLILFEMQLMTNRALP